MRGQPGGGGGGSGGGVVVVVGDPDRGRAPARAVPAAARPGARAPLREAPPHPAASRRAPHRVPSLPHRADFSGEVTFAFPPPPSPGDQRRRRARGRCLGSGASCRSQTFAPGLGLHHPHHTLGRAAPAPSQPRLPAPSRPPAPARGPSPRRCASSALSLCPRCPPPPPGALRVPHSEEGWSIWRARCPLCLPGTGFEICCWGTKDGRTTTGEWRGAAPSAKAGGSGRVEGRGWGPGGGGAGEEEGL